MKIYNRIVLTWDDELQEFVEESSESYEYSGPVAKAKGGGEQTQTVNNDPWSKQQPYLEELFRAGQSAFRGGAPDTARSGTALREYVNTLNQTRNDITPFLTQARSSNQFLLGDVLSPETNPALQSYIDMSNNAISKQFNENIMPRLTSQNAAVGNIGSSRQAILEGNAVNNVMDTIARNTAQLTNAGYGQGLNAYTKGIALAPQTAAMAGLPADYARQGYAAQQEAEMLPFNREMDLLRAYQSIVGGAGYGGTQTSTTPYESGGLTGALGGAAAGAGVASAMPTAMASANPYIIGGAALLGYLS